VALLSLLSSSTPPLPLAHVFNAFARLHPRRCCPTPLLRVISPRDMPAKQKANNKSHKGRSGHSRGRTKHPGRRLLPMAMVPPSARKVNLVWCGTFGATESSAGAGAFNFYRLNSVYDVDTAVGSTATPGFVEWSAFYSNYRVWKTRFRIEGTVSGLSSGAVCTVCLVPNPLQATLPSAGSEWPVQPGSIHKTVVNYSNGGTNMFVLDKQFSLPSVFRITQAQFKSDFDFSATTSANPARQAYVAVTIKSNSSTVAAAYGQVYVSMSVEFFNPILLAS
jgi:hypothetical protein